MIPSFREIRLKSLNKDLEKQRQDYEAIDEKKRRESNPVEKGNLQSQLDSTLKEIEEIEQKIAHLNREAEENKYNIEQLQEILSKLKTDKEISILKKAFHTCSVLKVWFTWKIILQMKRY